jgi:glycerol-3-phosphate acyltransferase PlsX
LIEADEELNFVGFTEGHSMFDGDLDIMVCDGFLGNILLKFAEGAAELIVHYLREEIKGDLIAAFAAKLFQRRALKRFASRLDYTVFGGAPLLGLKGNVVICHGRSPANAIKNALLLGYRLAQANMSAQVEKYVELHPQFLAARNSIAKNGKD